MSITVLLTAYKRIYCLKEQLYAIKNQTFKPDKIVLFQDKVEGDYSIHINDNLIKEFDDVRIADTNMGVWGRFEYAMQADTEYICIFDDDTIPGKRWIENCFNQMQLHEGIYGTIGIILRKNTNYPFGKYIRVGWDCPNEQTNEVDFVGHSWFIKTEWLKYMFDETGRYKKDYKYVAEDMSLSFACLKHEIHTYVPPHPVNDIDMWGSIPELALKYGSSAALSKINSNFIAMHHAIKRLLQDNWEPLYIRDSTYVNRMKKNYNKNLRKKKGIKMIKIIKAQIEKIIENIR